MIFIALICFLGGIILLYISDNVKDIPDLKTAFRVVGIGFIFMSGGWFDYLMYSQDPSAIDVYRGETTLEITYRDNIPIDSVVVFKNYGNF